MPFFKRQPEKSNKKIMNVALQAPGSCISVWRKRVLSSAFCKRGSLTLEAALSLSLFIFASVCLMLPMQMLDLNRRIQTVLEVTAEELSQYLYLRWRTESGDSAEKDLGMYEEVLSRILAEGYLKNKIMDTAGAGKIKNLRFSGTKIMQDEEHVELCVHYDFIMPFSVLNLKSIPMTARSMKRVWIGKEGGKGNGTGSGKEEEDQTVYVGRSSERYHWFRNCHYLDNKIETISWEELESRRNQSGSRYKPCRVCGGGTGGTVYIMSSGESYHRDRYCSSIISYVEAVPLSQVKHLGACSYCERMKGE